jgi:hypothetical protein
MKTNSQTIAGAYGMRRRVGEGRPGVGHPSLSAVEFR